MHKQHRFTPGRLRHNIHLILTGSGIAVIYWILDAFASMVLCSGGNFWMQLFRPESHELWHRLLNLSLIFLLFISFRQFLNRHTRVENEFKRRNKELAALNTIAATVSQSLDLNQILNDALNQVQQLGIVGSQVQSIVFLLNDDDKLVPTAYRGAPANHPCLAHPPRLGECLCGQAAQSGEIRLSEHCRLFERPLPRHNVPDKKDICLPLNAHGKTLGALNVRLPVTQGITDNDIQLLTAIADQISVAIENARLFEAVNQQRTQLRHLTARLAETEEAERHRISRELHDRVGQNLTALGLNLNVARSLINGNSPNGVHARLDESIMLVEETAVRIRNLMAELRPPILDDFGLVAALRWYGQQFSERFTIAVVLDGDGFSNDLSPAVETALFRITQEALNNVVKHAQAQQVTITLTDEGAGARLVVADDGVGLGVNGNGRSTKHGWGQLIMSERAEAVGGHCRIESPSGQGTQVTVVVGNER